MSEEVVKEPDIVQEEVVKELDIVLIVKLGCEYCKDMIDMIQREKLSEYIKIFDIDEDAAAAFKPILVQDKKEYSIVPTFVSKKLQTRVFGAKHKTMNDVIECLNKEKTNIVHN
jgi:hypothetical protein